MIQELLLNPAPLDESPPSLVLYDYGQNIKEMRDNTIATREIFRSDSHWLYPLFEVEQYLLYVELKRKIKRVNCTLYDKMIGMASAYLILHLRITAVMTKMASVSAITLLKAHGVDCFAESIVIDIGCRTEELCSAKQALSIDKAYRVLVNQANYRENK